LHQLKRAWGATWRILAFVLLWSVLLIPSIAFIGSEPGEGLGRGLQLFLELFGLAAVLLAAGAMLRFADRRTFRSLGFAPARAGWDLLLGLLLGGAMITLALVLAQLAGWSEWLPGTGFSWSVLGVLALLVLVNSITQEVLVRGYILQTIERSFGGPTAVVISSLLFTGLHAGALVEGGVLAGFNLFAAGLLLGVAFTTTRNLWLPIGLHFSWNLLQGPVLGVAVSGQALDGGWKLVRLDGPSVFTGGAFGLEGGLLGTTATVSGLVALLLLRGRPQRDGMGGESASYSDC